MHRLFSLMKIYVLSEKINIEKCIHILGVIFSVELIALNIHRSTMQASLYYSSECRTSYKDLGTKNRLITFCHPSLLLYFLCTVVLYNLFLTRSNSLSSRCNIGIY